MSAPGRACWLLLWVAAGAMAPARAAADDMSCTASGARSASATLHLTLRWRAGAAAQDAAVGAPPSSITSTRPPSASAAAALGTTTATLLAQRLPDPVELSTVNGQALSWSRTALYAEPTWQAVWTAQGQGGVGGERAEPATDSAWFCPHWPGGSQAVTVDYRIGSDPLPAGAEAGELPRGWRRSGRVQAPLGAWVPLSPQPGAPADDSRRAQAVTGRRVATEASGSTTPVLEMRWLLEAAAVPSETAAGPRSGARPLPPDRRP